MAKKLYDLCVKTSTYQVNGEEKGRYLNVGAVMQGDKGKFIMLEKSFNPAGIETRPGSSAILISIFEPKNHQQEQPGKTRGVSDNYEDDIPF